LLAPPLLFAAFWIHGETDDDLVNWPLGMVLILAGVTLRVWAQQHLRHRLRQAMRLTTSGPYRFIRNPLYVGNTLVCVGATFLSELLWWVPVTLAWCCILYAFVVRFEEKHLQGLYGAQYQEYRSSVPRWFPRRFSFDNLGMMNNNLWASLRAESAGLLIILPYILKEIVEPFVRR